MTQQERKKVLYKIGLTYAWEDSIRSMSYSPADYIEIDRETIRKMQDAAAAIELLNDAKNIAKKLSELTA